MKQAQRAATKKSGPGGAPGLLVGKNGTFLMVSVGMVGPGGISGWLVSGQITVGPGESLLR